MEALVTPDGWRAEAVAVQLAGAGAPLLNRANSQRLVCAMVRVNAQPGTRGPACGLEFLGVRLAVDSFSPARGMTAALPQGSGGRPCLRDPRIDTSGHYAEANQS